MVERRCTPVTVLAVWIAAVLSGCGAQASTADQGPFRVGLAHHPPYCDVRSDLFFGIDVDLARDLGASLGRAAEFVPTEFSTILADLVAGRFDIAMGGIHVTRNRAQAVQVSTAYWHVGRQLIVRCREVARFAEPSDVDRMGVEVLATLGGASAEFAAERFPRATILRARHGEEAVERLARGEGDAALADALSASNYTRRDAELCIGLGGTVLAEFPLAILLRPDSPLLASVDRWVRARTRDGTIRRVVLSHVINALAQSEAPSLPR